MKKTVILSIVAVIGSIMIVGCSVKDSAQPSSMSVKSENVKSGVIDIKNSEFTQSKIHKLIVKAGEEDGWKMTEFKEDEVIAEKMEDGETVAVSVKFDTNTVELTPEDSDLSNAISTILDKK